MNVQVENGYTKIANQILEELGKTYLSPYEWQMLMVIFRKTYGYGKKNDWMAINQLVEATGMHRSHVSRTMKKLKARNIVTQTGNTIAFNKDYSRWLPKQVTKINVPIQAQSVPKQAQLVPKQAPTKETITKETIQKKEYIAISDLTNFHFQAIAERYGVPLSFVISKYDDMVNWHESTGKTKKDWVATLRNFVKKDALSIRKEASDQSKIGFATDGGI